MSLRISTIEVEYFSSGDVSGDVPVASWRSARALWQSSPIWRAQSSLGTPGASPAPDAETCWRTSSTTTARDSSTVPSTLLTSWRSRAVRPVTNLYLIRNYSSIVIRRLTCDSRSWPEQNTDTGTITTSAAPCAGLGWPASSTSWWTTPRPPAESAGTAPWVTHSKLTDDMCTDFSSSRLSTEELRYLRRGDQGGPGEGLCGRRQLPQQWELLQVPQLLCWTDWQEGIKTWSRLSCLQFSLPQNLSQPVANMRTLEENYKILFIIINYTMICIV